MTIPHVFKTFPALLAALAALILIVHGHTLGLFYVQDDAWAWMGARDWARFYTGIATDLQYRPNAFLLTHLLSYIAPEEPWPLRATGLALLWVLGALAYIIVKRLSGRPGLAAIAAALLVLHPGYYSMGTLYLAAVMTGLGVVCVFLGVWAAHVFASNPKTRSWMATFAAMIAALTSYEAAIIVLPLMMGVDYFYSARPHLLHTIWRYTPHMALTAGYLYLRTIGIEHVTEAGQAGFYAPSAHMAVDNATLLLRSLWGYPMSTSWPHILPKIMPSLVLAVAALAWTFARKHQLRIFWLGASIWMILGILPFLFMGGQSLHYVFYAIPGFVMLLAMTVQWGFERSRKGGTALLAILLGSFIVLNISGYNTGYFVDVANTGQNIHHQYERLALSDDKRDIVFMNINTDLAWRIHFGNSLDHRPVDQKRRFIFPQDGNHTFVTPSDFAVTPTYLYTEHYADDPKFTRSRMADASAWVMPKHSWRPITPTLSDPKTAALTPVGDGGWRITARQDIKDLTLNWSPPKGNEPVSIRFHPDADHAGFAIESAWTDKDGSTIRCKATGTSLALPPVAWGHDDHIALTLPAMTKGSSLTIKSVEAKTGFDVAPEAGLQICDGSMLP